jgi:hypothetical protein
MNGQMASPPSPFKITSSAFSHALGLYPQIIGKVYQGKLKDTKKVQEALTRDIWRYEELPATVAAMRQGKASEKNGDIEDGGLSKLAVERLVQWKM